MQQTCLTADEMHQMLEALEASATSGEYRASHRAKLCAAFFIAPVLGDTCGEAFPVLGQDLSCRGVAFLHNQAIRIGSQFIIASSSSLTRLGLIMFTVVYCAPADDGRFRIGGKFLNVPNTGGDLSNDVESDPLFQAIFAD